MHRRTFFASIGTGLVALKGLACSNQSRSSGDISPKSSKVGDKKRKAARWRKRRIIYNNDGDDVVEVRTGPHHRHDVEESLTTRSGGELIDDFLSTRSTPLVGSQVDSNWYSSCMAGLTFSHHTKLGGFYGKGIPQELVDKYGRDSLQIQVDFSHQNGMEAFWSLRMNDVHDSYPMGSRRWTYGLAPFKRDHPEYMMGEAEDWEKYPDSRKRYWSALDFSFSEVREHYFSLIEEVAQNYDVEGIELDFLRAYPYFPPTMDMLPVKQQHLEMMTDLVRRVRNVANEVGQQRGRPLLLAARTPFKVEDARFIGLDLEKWLTEDLIDLLIPGGSAESEMTESYRQIVDLGHKYDVPVYPCISWGFWGHWAFLDLGAEEHRTSESWMKTLSRGQPGANKSTSRLVALNSWEGAPAAWRGAAMNLFNAGADGIYLFNPALAGPDGPDAWRGIGDPETMAGKDKIYGVDRFGGDSSFHYGQGGHWRKGVRELELKEGETVSVHFQVGEDVKSGNGSKLRFRLHVWDLANKDDLGVKLNNEPLDDLRPDAPAQIPSAGQSGQWLECRLDPAKVNRGENKVELVVRGRDGSMQTPPVLDAVQLHVHHGK